MREPTSLAELEGCWRRADSLTRTRDWINGGWLLLVTLVFGWGYRDLAWALWTNVVWTSAAVVVASVILRLTGVDRSGHPASFWLGLAGGSFGAIVGVGIVGALLSFFAEHEPAALLGRNGFVNAGLTTVLAHTTRRYAAILVLAINELVYVVRAALTEGTPALDRLGGFVGKLVGALVVGGVVGVALVAVASPWAAVTGLGLFYVAWFVFPWRVVTRDSIQDQRSQGRAALYAGATLPLRAVDRAAPLMVLVVAVLAGMFTVAGAAVWAIGVRDVARVDRWIGGAILLAIGLGCLAVGGFLAVLGITLARSVKCVVVTRTEVAIEERGWDAPEDASWRRRLSAVFRTRSARVPLAEYPRVARSVERRVSSDGPDYDETAVILKHAHDGAKDVVLYRAYHDRHLGLVEQHYARLLGLPVA